MTKETDTWKTPNWLMDRKQFCEYKLSSKKYASNTTKLDNKLWLKIKRLYKHLNTGNIYDK